MTDSEKSLGRLLKQQRQSLPLTLSQLAKDTGVSPSHLGRIERGERLPSARVLRRIARPLGFEEGELFTLAGFFSATPSSTDNAVSLAGKAKRLDPLVAASLADEPVAVQRAIIGVLSILKTLKKSAD